MLSIIFRCSKKDEMYLYLPYDDKPDESSLIEQLPEGLQQLTGRLEKVMELDITPDCKLARADTQDVLHSLEQKGYYLQMPPNDVFQQDSRLDDPGDGF